MRYWPCRPTPGCRWWCTAPSPTPPPRTASSSWPAGRPASTKSSRRRRPRRPRTHDRQSPRCARARRPGAMTSPAQSVQRDAVSPLELFFDLVYVFAVSQLSHHLLDHLTWRGAAETLVLLNIGRSPTQWMLLAVMLAGLFMNAAIQNSFEAGGWAFVIPLLAIQAGRSILMIVTAPTRMLREHYARLLCVIRARAPLWIAGAISHA